MAAPPTIIPGMHSGHNGNQWNAGIPQGAPVRMHETTNLNQPYLIDLPPGPVRVEVAGGTEVLRYREADMAVGRLYRFRWEGEEFAALRSRDGVEILKFVPDAK